MKVDQWFLCFLVGLGYFTWSNRKIFLSRNNLLSFTEAEFTWDLLSRWEKKEQLSLFESGHLFEHDLLLFPAIVLMGIFHLCMKWHLFIISWFSYGKCLFYWKLTLLLVDRLVKAVYYAYEWKHWEYKSGKSLSLSISSLWLQTGTMLDCFRVHAVILISVR